MPAFYLKIIPLSYQPLRRDMITVYSNIGYRIGQRQGFLSNHMLPYSIIDIGENTSG